MARTAAERRGDLVGRDMHARPRAPGRSFRVSPALLVVLLGAALAVAALRVDLIRVRYGLADAVSREKALLEERREAQARLGSLRDPARLANLADEYGLARPERIIELPLLPAVAAAPAETAAPSADGAGE
jgi:hypothetical protein